MESTELQHLQGLAREARKEVLALCHSTKTGHVGPAFSVMEILVALYHRAVRGDVADPSRDRVILSKGHACSSLYVVLKQKGWLSQERLASFASNGCELGHHPHYEPGIGLDANTGSLGHGLPLGCGLALAAKRDGRATRAYVILGDGEANEGSNWEAAGFASHHRLDNLCMILDANQIQAMGSTREVQDPIDHAAKWAAFGWDVHQVDGHDLEALSAALDAPARERRPKAIIAHTVKGKGVSFMEGRLLWHYRQPTAEDVALACEELK